VIHICCHRIEATSGRIDVPSTGSFLLPTTARGGNSQLDLRGGENGLDKLDSSERYVDSFADGLDLVVADVTRDLVDSNREESESWEMCPDKTCVTFRSFIGGTGT
jgi:hypothetical protein